MWVLRIARSAVPLTVGAYALCLVPGVIPHDGLSTVRDVGLYPGALAVSATVCGFRAQRLRRNRLPWALVAVGLTSYSTGTLIFYSILNTLDPVPYPSVSDALWLSFYPLAIVAISLMVRARARGSSASMWLDGIVSGLGLASLSALLVFPRVSQGATGGFAAVATNFAYPLLDLALLTSVAGGMATLGMWRHRPWMLLAGGFAVFSAADSGYLLQLVAGSYHPGSLVDLGYLVAAALVAEAAASDVGTDEIETSRERTQSFLVPGVFALAAIGVLATSVWDEEPLALILAVGALLAAWARTWLTVREVRQLADSRRQARTDVLTGLPNRRAFYEIVEADASRSGQVDGPSAAVILTDLDGFKEINDALGHQLGDQLLQQVSRRLEAMVPDSGTIARLGGDEMALFVPDLTTEAASVLCTRLLGSLHEPFQIQDMSVHLGASAGIAAVDPEDGPGRALAKADLAMYRAKASHSGWAVYDDRCDGDAWDRLATVEALRETLAIDGLTLELQPINGIAPARPVGVEALVRWQHPTRGRIAPDQFLPLAERSGLMSAVTRTVVDQALDAAQRLDRLGHQLSVSVNLSASDLLDNRLAEQIEAALTARDLRPACLHLEITESLFVDSRSGALDQLTRLRDMGIALVVDDYGTGYSCLAYLHHLPVSCLKIDRGFTQRVLLDRRTALIVASTIEMAHGLGLEVVAEGVEREEELDWLAEHGCDLAQGYLLGRPMAADALLDWLADKATPPPDGARVPAPRPARPTAIRT